MFKGFCGYVYLTFLILLVHPAIANSEDPEITRNNHWYTGILLDLGVTLPTPTTFGQLSIMFHLQLGRY